MKQKFSSKRQREDRGYALLFVLFLMALIIIGASTAALDQLTEGRRDKEAVMIWRGKQYQRAVGLFYKKFGRFPTNVDDLIKVQNGAQRFLREAYKNPMNKEGTWRFIYVTPAGQLIGSVQYVSLQQMAFLDQQRRLGLMSGPGGSASTDNSDNFENSSANAVQARSSMPGGNPGPTGASGGVNSQIPSQFQLPSLLSPLGQQSGGSSFFTQPGQAQSGTIQSNGLNVQESGSDNSGNGQVIGGFIIGVAGTQDKSSIKVYKGGATYKRWEFIFNPLEQVQTIGTVSIAPSNPTGSPLPGTPQAPNPQQQPQ